MDNNMTNNQTPVEETTCPDAYVKSDADLKPETYAPATTDQPTSNNETDGNTPSDHVENDGTGTGLIGGAPKEGENAGDEEGDLKTTETVGVSDDFTPGVENFVGNLPYMGNGMLAIFVVIGVIIGVTALLNKVFKK